MNQSVESDYYSLSVMFWMQGPPFPLVGWSNKSHLHVVGAMSRDLIGDERKKDGSKFSKNGFPACNLCGGDSYFLRLLYFSMRGDRMHHLSIWTDSELLLSLIFTRKRQRRHFQKFLIKNIKINHWKASFLLSRNIYFF